MRTSAEPLEGNKVKLTIEVDEDEIVRAEQDALARLAREARVPGFRPGKVPRRLLEARLGKKGIREEVLRESLGDYYADAIEEAALDPIAAPEIDVTEGEESGPVVFSAVVEVRPEISIAGYEGLVVTVERPEPSEEEVATQVDRLRSQFATLTEVDRPAIAGDLVTLDVQGTRDGAPAEGLSADDLVYEVGTGGIADGVDDLLTGSKVGDIFEMDAQDTPDGPAHLRLLVKLVREKVLPDADDAFATDASEFETFAELRDDLANRMTSVKRLQSTLELRERAVEALTNLVVDEAPATLVDDQSNQLVRDLVYRLAESRVRLEDYLAAMGENSEEFLTGVRSQAERDVRTDLALRAIARDQDLEPDISDIDEEVVHLAGHAGQSPAAFREMLESNGRMGELKAEVRKSKAMTWLLEHVAIVDPEGSPIERDTLRTELLSGHDHDHDDENAGDDTPTPYSEEP